MKRIVVFCSIATTLAGVAAFAGALYVEVENPEANREATALHAVVVARVTACHEPAKSVVTANAVRMIDGKLQRIPLEVAPLATAGAFAIVGSIPASNPLAIELAVTNPQFKNYEPRVLIRRDANGFQWAGAKRFFSVPPGPADFRAALE